MPGTDETVQESHSENQCSPDLTYTIVCEQIERMIALSTEQQNLERATRAATRDAARERRNNNPNQPRTIPKPGDLNSMLAWAIENSEPEKLKEIKEVSEKVQQRGGTDGVQLSDAEAALIGAESDSMLRGANEMAR